MFDVFARSIFIALVVVVLTPVSASAARAEDLVMPYSCTVHGKDLHVAPANNTAYRIVGRRFEQPFVACSQGAATCETMMVHRFTIECDGTQISWSRITQAAAQSGVKLPAGMPAGFAPVSALSGRFVLPALVRTSAQHANVLMQDLSPDSVTETSDDWRSSAADGGDAQWVTEVHSDVLRSSHASNAGHVAASLGGVLLMLFAVSMVAAGRWRMTASPTVFWPPNAAGNRDALARMFKRAQDALAQMRSKLERHWHAGDNHAPTDATANALLILQARLIDVEFAVATLAPSLLLRQVLSTEVEAIRGRVVDLERQASRMPAQKVSIIVRNLLRDLDRISRIAKSADQAASEGSASDVEHDTPRTMAEAYRVLGINPDAAPAVAKKLVDALRMSWHPDHARNEGDRRHREGRMKQINAAWDMVKTQRAAA